MQHKWKLLAIAAVGAVLAVGSVAAADQDRDQSKMRDQDRMQTSDQDQIRDRDIYGYGMMTASERDAYRSRMLAAKTAQEREQIRAEHHAQMLTRAKDRGMTLPPESPMGNQGMGGMGGPEIRGPGPTGPGPGGGMGGGMRR